MKWFKHDCDALSDAKIEKLIMKYGLEGYGLYFACVELIAKSISKDNVTFELEHDAELLGHKFRMDSRKVEEIMTYCMGIGLFGLCEISGRVTCYKLAHRLDDSTAKNPEFKELLELIRKNSEKLLPEEKRREEKRKEKKRVLPANIEEVYKYAKEKDISAALVDRFYDYFTESDWVDSNGKTVLNWKQKLLTWAGYDKKSASDDERQKALKEAGII